MIMKSLMRLFRSDPNVAEPLYTQVVAKARSPHWYVAGRVPDTMEGRFSVLATLLALTDLRLEEGGDEARKASVALAECFVHDMDSQLRQDGVGDPVMGKRVGSLVGALGGRLGAWRKVIAGRRAGKRWLAVRCTARRCPPKRRCYTRSMSSNGIGRRFRVAATRR
jgi:cytochrome b pre-mRNA-processing protein 3